MKRLLGRTACDERGLAGIEFAMVVPILLMLVGGVADFALVSWNRGLLANSVAQGAQYAFLTGSKVSTSSIQGIVGQKLSLPTADVVVTGPGCYCVSGMPAIKVGQACVQPCPNKVMPNTYIVITARYTYEPILPFYSSLATTVLIETATIRLK